MGMVVLSGCASAPPAPVEVVKVPVAVPCVREMPERPAFITDEEWAALDAYKKALALWKDRRERQDYEAKLEATLEACRF
jgi:hypothetical protein